MATLQKKYQSDGGDIHRIRLSSEKFAVSNNPEPAGGVNNDIIVKISKGNREYGIRPRGVVLSRVVTGGVAPAAIVEKTLKSFLPIFTSASFNAAAYNNNANVSYRGFTWVVSAKREEDY